MFRLFYIEKIICFALCRRNPLMLYHSHGGFTRRNAEIKTSKWRWKSFCPVQSNFDFLYLYPIIEIISRWMVLEIVDENLNALKK